MTQIPPTCTPDDISLYVHPARRFICLDGNRKIRISESHLYQRCTNRNKPRPWKLDEVMLTSSDGYTVWPSIRSNRYIVCGASGTRELVRSFENSEQWNRESSQPQEICYICLRYGELFRFPAFDDNGVEHTLVGFQVFWHASGAPTWIGEGPFATDGHKILCHVDKRPVFRTEGDRFLVPGNPDIAVTGKIPEGV